MPSLPEIAEVLAPHGLAVTGAFHPTAAEGPEGIGTLCMVGADGTAMWPVFTTSPEHADGETNPLDRWSARVIGGAAA
ncbi:MAG: ferredoxin, partial [Pseudomonadota bacterium]